MLIELCVPSKDKKTDNVSVLKKVLSRKISKFPNLAEYVMLKINIDV